MLTQILVQFLLPKPTTMSSKTTKQNPKPTTLILLKNKKKTVRFNITIHDIQTIIPSFKSINDSNLDVSSDKTWYNEEDYIKFKEDIVMELTELIKTKNLATINMKQLNYREAMHILYNQYQYQENEYKYEYDEYNLSSSKPGLKVNSYLQEDRDIDLPSRQRSVSL